MKCDYLDMQASGAMESITAHMTFDNFDQSMRFLNLIINFIREEKANAKAPHAPEAEAGQHEAAVEGQVQDQPQASCWQDRQHPVEAHSEIVEIAKDLVALWESPKIQGLPRADRNEAIQETRNRMIAAVAALSRS